MNVVYSQGNRSFIAADRVSYVNYTIALKLFQPDIIFTSDILRGDIHESGCRLFNCPKEVFKCLKTVYTHTPTLQPLNTPSRAFHAAYEPILKGMMKMDDLGKIEELQERKAQLQAKYNSLKSDILNAMSIGTDSGSVFLEFDALSKEIQTVNEQIFNIEHADEVKAQQERQAQEEERKARELADREKRIQEAKLAEEKRKAEFLAQERAKAEAKQKAKAEAKAKVDQELAQLKGNKSSVNRLHYTAEKILNSLKIQIIPSAECVEPNEAFTKALFRFGSNSFKQALQGKSFAFKEAHQNNKHDEIWSKLSVTNAEGYDDDTPLDEYDRAVLGVIISEYLVNNRYTTINIVFRALVGKVGDQNVRPSKNQEAAIIHSIHKLRHTDVDFSGVNESLKEMKYRDKDGNEIIFRNDYLLSASIIDAKINGQPVEGVIYFKDSCPLFDIANLKDQVIRYPHSLLNVPSQNNTPLVIALKKYVMRRICEIKLHKQMAPTITFEDVFKRCRLGNVGRDQQYNARNVIIKFFAHLKAQNFITDFEVKKRRNVIHGISFSYS